MFASQPQPKTFSEKPQLFWQVYKFPLILAGSSLLLIVISIILLVKSTQVAGSIKFSKVDSSVPASSSAKTTSLIAVDVAGAVINPGVYHLPIGSRVGEAVAAAGGLSDQADREQISKTINLAAKLSDGAKIYFAKIGKNQTTSAVGQVSGATTLINVNTASQAELESLPGVGPVTAGKIINNRPYQTLEELVSKKAVGQALLEKIKGQLAL